MLNYKSKKLYYDLKAFFAEENKILQKIFLSSFFGDEIIEIVKKELKLAGKEFSNEFFDCIALGRRLFIPEKLYKILKMLLDELEEEFEDPQCTIITSLELTSEKKHLLEAKMQEKYSALRFEYIINPEIIGGIVFRLGNCYYDGSFRQILSDIKMNIQKEMQYGRF